jgi:transcriptional regulator
MLHDDRGLLQGTLPLLILEALRGREAHGYGVARWIEAVTDDALRVEEGSLYPALHRMKAKGWVEASWGRSENNRRARFYRLTDRGRAELHAQRRGWQETVEAVAKVMDTSGRPAAEGA